MHILDAHVHFWRFDPARDSWITDDMSVIRKDFLPEQLAEEFKRNDVTGCIAVQADQSEQEHNFLLELAAGHDLIKGVVGWIDLSHRDVSKKIASYSSTKKLVGFRNIIQGEPDERYFTNKDFREGMNLLSPLGYTYDVLIYHNQLPSAIAFTEKYPDQSFMLDHIAKPDIKNGQWKKWREDIRDLSRNPNMFCKLSGVITEADWSVWTYDSLVPYLETVAEYFGTDRLCFGSDWPVSLVAGGYSEVLQVIRKFLIQVSEDEKEKVLSGNTERFYKLN